MVSVFLLLHVLCDMFITRKSAGQVGFSLCCFLFLTQFIISPKIATELFRCGRIERPLAKAAIEKMRIEGRYAPDIIAEALLETGGDWKC